MHLELPLLGWRLNNVSVQEEKISWNSDAHTCLLSCLLSAFLHLTTIFIYGSEHFHTFTNLNYVAIHSVLTCTLSDGTSSRTRVFVQNFGKMRSESENSRNINIPPGVKLLSSCCKVSLVAVSSVLSMMTLQ